MSEKEMASHLLIVESPAKSKTISRFLGEGYEVASSFGHIRDLKTKGMGVDVENNFAPDYEVSEDKANVVKDLRNKAKKADKIWLASDEDREGEAIAWHLAEVLGLDTSASNRIVFHEITPDAIKHALANPRRIDMEMVDAQQARRVLDRIVGFELSPVLWQKVRPGLSAGRVQSVAVRILVEREREINAFVAESTFRVRATFKTTAGETFMAELDKRVPGYDEAKALLESLVGNDYSVDKIEVKPALRHPAPPFTTSTLQQEASRRMGMPVGVTMRVAQSLYESGYITYMRTDSVNLSAFAMATTAKEIEKQFGEKYVKTRNFKTSTKGAQEAHEAIRPTHVEMETVPGTKQEKALYDLIRKRTIATQMAPAKLERTQVDILSNNGHRFVAKGEVIKFDGFLKVYLEGNDDDEQSGERDLTLLPAMSKGDELKNKEVIATERFTQRPPRYTEAALVKKMEELGIGRPSTYATTIQTIQKRGYVEKQNLDGTKRTYRELRLASGKITDKEKEEVYGADRQKLVPSDVGIVVNDFLVKYFPKVLDYNFTAKVEKEFDAIAEGKKPWTKVLQSFYLLFHDNVTTVQSERMDHRVGERLIGTDPESGENVFAKIGRYGPMIQIGDSGEDNKKPRFASVPKEKSIETITLEEALRLFDLPRDLGTYEGDDVLANNGRFGPYVKFGNLFASIPKDLSVFEITLEEAIPLIEKKKEQERLRHIASFGPEDDLVEIQNGRWGPFIKYKKKNYKIPKDVDPLKLTEEEVRKLIAEGGATTKKAPAKKAPAKKSPAAKKAPAKKSTATKKASATKKSTATKKKSADK